MGPNDAPVFFVVNFIDLVLLTGSVVVQAVAFVHCLTRRADGFPAIGTLPKGAWLAILIIALLLTMMGRPSNGFSSTSIFSLIGVAAGLIYLLDVRVGLRDLRDGKGFW